MKHQESTTEITLLRHGECEGGRIFRGRSDVALLPQGERAMSHALSGFDHPWDIVLSSPLKRCKHFATAYCKQHALPLAIEPKLQEMDFGDWDGQLIEDIWQKDKATIESWSNDPSSITPPGGEPLLQVKHRVSRLLNDVCRVYRSKNILMVTHGGVIRLILGEVLNTPLSVLNRFEVPYACVSQIAFYRHREIRLAKLIAHNVGV